MTGNENLSGKEVLFIVGSLVVAGIAVAASGAVAGIALGAVCIGSFVIVKTVKKNLALQELAGPNGAVVFYEGGHPDARGAGQVALVPTESGILMRVREDAEVMIPYDDIVSLSLDANVQNVNTGGGRSVGGAVVGMALAGPLGAIVGGNRSTKVQKIDESKTYLVIRYGKIQVQLIFSGGSETYGQVAPLLAKAA